MINEVKQQLINYLQKEGKTDTWVNLYNRFPFKGEFLNNKQKSDTVRKLFKRKVNRATSSGELPKILIFDLETAPLRAYVWRLWKQNVSPVSGQLQSEWFMLTWAAKWLFENEIMSDSLTPKEVFEEDDSRLTKSIYKLVNEADIVVAHNACVQKDTKILMQDLTWKKAGDLRKGDKLVGFEEKTKPGVTRRDSNGKWRGKGERKIKPSEVTNINIERRLCYKVTFDNGDEVITTRDHYWLGMAEKSRNQQWYRTDRMRIGQRVNKFISPWEKEDSYEAGWLSGFIEGEGTLKGNGASIDFCQRPTIVLEKAVKACKNLNIDIADLKTKKGGLGRGDTLYTYTLGGKWKTLEVLGKLRIDRLIQNLDWNKFGGLNSNSGGDFTRTIVAIEDVGVQEVAVLETSTSTYIAEGYPMHNCNFDVPTLNTRFIKNGLMPPTPYRVIDTLKESKKHFRFESNKLDYLGQTLGLGNKIKTTFSLWENFLKGDKSAMNEMLKYNEQDVLLLEDVYLTLRPYIKSHPNLNLYIESDVNRCPSCMSDQLSWEGNYATNVNRYRSFRCKSCGSVGRSRESNISKEHRKSLTVSIAR